MYFDIYCPKCGDFADAKPATKGCPRCGAKDAFSLHHREDIDMRFREEREKFSVTKPD